MQVDNNQIVGGKMSFKNNIVTEIRYMAHQRDKPVSIEYSGDIHPSMLGDVLIEHALRQVGPDIHKSLWSDALKGELKDVVIGGYGNPNVPYGAGPTRPMDHATYALRLIATAESQDLSRVWRFPSEPLAAFLNGLDSILIKGSHYETMQRRKGLLVMAKGPVKTGEIYAGVSGIVSGIKGKGTVKGDLSFYGTIMFGSGLGLIADEDDESRMSMKTADVLNGDSRTGVRFRRKIRIAKQQLDELAKSVRTDYNKKTWLLTIDNV